MQTMSKERAVAENKHSLDDVSDPHTDEFWESVAGLFVAAKKIGGTSFEDTATRIKESVKVRKAIRKLASMSGVRQSDPLFRSRLKKLAGE